MDDGLMREPENFGCLFCRTGHEDATADDIRRQFPDILALSAAQMKHKSVQGKRFHERCIMLPGYVFLKTSRDTLPVSLYRLPGVLRLLYEEERFWTLRNENKEFAAWICANNGLIDISKAYSVGQSVRIVDGPLKERQGSILKVDKRNRNCYIALKFNACVFQVWLAFDYIMDEASAPQSSRRAFADGWKG